MDEMNKSTPLDMLCVTLAAMTQRCTEAEHQIEKAKADADMWLKCYRTKAQQCDELTKSLNAEVIAHNNTRAKLRKYIADLEETSHE